MKVSMNGLRRNLSNNVANLLEIVICLKEDLGSEDFNELCEAVNNVIQDSNVLNCVLIQTMMRILQTCRILKLIILILMNNRGFMELAIFTILVLLIAQTNGEVCAISQTLERLK